MWFLLPGIIGFLLITMLPLAISRAGALAVFLALIAGQVVAGMLWDALREGRMPDVPRVAASLLVIAGAALASWR